MFHSCISGYDLKMQLTAPMSFGWGAVGIGSQMAGALMFMIYPSSNSQGTSFGQDRSTSIN